VLIVPLIASLYKGLTLLLWVFPSQKLYEELLHYREEYRSAAEKLCACRHMSNLPDVSIIIIYMSKSLLLWLIKLLLNCLRLCQFLKWFALIHKVIYYVVGCVFMECLPLGLKLMTLFSWES